MSNFPDDPSKLEVGLAFGADISADPTTLTYTTVTSTVQPEILITRGRISDSSITQPTAVDLRLLDANGVYSPRNIYGPHYGQLRRNTPIRVRVDTGSGLVTRAITYVPSWSPTWIGPNMGDKIGFQASGIMRRLGQGGDPFSALRRTILAAGPQVYWPLEDSAGATQCATLTPGTAAPLTPAGALPNFASDSRLAGSSPLPLFGSAGQMTAPISVAAAATQTVEFVCRMGPGNRAADVSWVPVGWSTATESWAVNIGAGAGGGFSSFIGAGDQTGTPLVFLSVSNPEDDIWHYYRFVMANSGSDLVISFYQDGSLLGTNTATGRSTHAIRSVFLNQVGGSSFLPGDFDGSIGHLAIYSGAISDHATVSLGYPGELAATRFSRICSEQGIVADLASGSTEAMGAQLPGTTFALLRECEDSDEATLIDRRDGRLGFDPTSSRYNQTVDLTLDYNTQIADIVQNDDDRDLFNDVTVSRVGGSFARVEQVSGTLSVDPVTGVGDYPISFTRSLSTDAQAVQHASWLVNIGTTDEPRFVVNLNLRQRKELIAQWLACDIGSRVLINNPPSIHTGPAPLDLIIEGYQELIDGVRWEVILWCLPYLPYEVYQVATGTGSRSHIPQEPGGTTVNAQRSPTDTSFAVTSANVRWIDSATFGAQFPFYVQVAGEVMQCTAITGTTLSQTMTMVRAIYGTAKTIPAGSEVQLWRAPVTAL